MRTQRGFVGVLIAIILGVIVLGGGAYFVTHQQATSESVSQNETVSDTSADAQINQNVTPATPLLASTMFVTPKGTPTLRPPQNWTSNVSSDGPSGSAAVTFVDPENADNNLGVVINSRTSDFTIDSDLYAVSTLITSKKGGKIVSTHKTENGYVFEARFPSINRYGRFIRIVSATKIYFISESATESDLSLYSPLFDQA